MLVAILLSSGAIVLLDFAIVVTLLDDDDDEFSIASPLDRYQSAVAFVGPEAVLLRLESIVAVPAKVDKCHLFDDSTSFVGNATEFVRVAYMLEKRPVVRLTLFVSLFSLSFLFVVSTSATDVFVDVSISVI